MAARISQRSRFNSVSFARFTLTFTTGTAAPISTSKMVMTTIISSSVTPRCALLFPFTSFTSLVYRDQSLRSLHVQRLVLAVACSRNGVGNCPRTLALSHEDQAEHRAIAGYAGRPGRPLGGYL